MPNSVVMAQEVGGIPGNKRSMKLERVPWNVRGLCCGRKRRLIRNILHTWKADVVLTGILQRH
ncbi:hypothetical protein MTR67_026838 [Solanum verrucosum]|uniref:Uncharacterized protein n=1 Tax=Solanum verrucosum TaxID=315347 RepID=A0AAF0R3P2_SOLVR|nr:hypothetical protein MTR67_026838 [Solanum verrucosum]